MGHNVLKIRYADTQNKRLINQQKVRVELLLEWRSGEVKPNAKSVKGHLLRKDVYPFIKQQEQLPWLNVKNFEYLIMDSFAELTDQKFTHRKDKRSFCCHYTDINHTSEFNAEFECCGLLPIESFEDAYNNFFDWFEMNHYGKKVFFFLFIIPPS